MRHLALELILPLFVCTSMSDEPRPTETAVIGGGCFWCLEAVFERLDGILTVESGYAGGTTENPTYEEVCTGNTGHAEVVRITFDPSVMSYESLLNMFWEAHDPTTLNRQGADAGTQYRSVIFYQSVQQKEAAERSRNEIQKSFAKPLVTTIEPLRKFYIAEEYHQDYFRNHPNAPYCAYVIRPKLDKLKLK